ncbi:lipopolysaccharide assembly protein LapB [Phenylobacterium sp.]|uniref:tetratricopeptide repeat protein n=1 Tax=Phenylobacterium sp. TaxID=1871053 RepID=UPI002719B074|nr:tetratricopeptide repeat protein [Phenylobacterium sp.]MDO8380136.1 tetratricopeptide repeat protein [Phenylobacterium sp.]
MSVATAPKLPRLLGFLERDPGNLQLLADAAATALDEGQPAKAIDLLDRYAATTPLPPELLNLSGVAALQEGRFGEAAKAFEDLLAQGHDDPGLRFNLAWAKAMLLDWARTADLIDDATVAAAPRAAALKVEALCHLGKLEEALAWGGQIAAQRPGDQALMGALAVAAMDAEQTDLARAYALKAGTTHEGLSTLGMLMLDQDDADEALVTFDRALAVYPHSARALLGKGLALLSKGDPRAAAGQLDEGAKIFGDHLGSWIASGWAHFASGDQVTARSRFETALALDDTFAESHGGLAVLDVIENDLESARRRTDIALRLDRVCFSGALARSMLLEHDGDPATAERIRQKAMNAPIGAAGRTLAQAMTVMAGRRPS